MKKIILLAVLAFIVLVSAQAQTYTVLDTVAVADQKWQIAESGLNRITTTYEKVFAREKIQTDTLTYLNETRALINYFQKGLDKYKLIFSKVDTLIYERKTCPQYTIATGQTISFDYYLNGNDSTQIGLIHEWDALNVRITEIENNTEISYQDAKNEFQAIKDQQAILERRYNKIKSQ